jgi:hypothetical protein
MRSKAVALPDFLLVNEPQADDLAAGAKIRRPRLRDGHLSYLA